MEMDPALAVAEQDVRDALQVAIEALHDRGYGVRLAALVLRGQLPDGDVFSVAQATGGAPRDLAKMLVWGAGTVLPDRY